MTTPDDARAFATESSEDGRRLWLVDVNTGDCDLLIELKGGAFDLRQVQAWSAR